MNNNTIEKLWNYVCNGNTTALRIYFKEHPENINQRYERYGTAHSLIMGAYRNNNFATVNYLISIGETITEEEQSRIDMEYRRMLTLKRLAKVR